MNLGSYLFIFPNAAIAKENATTIFDAYYQVVYAFRTLTLVAIVKAEMTRFFSVLSLRSVSNLNKVKL